MSKLALLPLLIWAWSSQSGIELVVAWLAGLAISSMTLGLQLGKLTRGESSRLEFRRLLEKRHLMVGHHWLNLSIQAPRLILPVLVVVIIGPRANAAFTAGSLWSVSSTSSRPNFRRSCSGWPPGMKPHCGTRSARRCGFADFSRSSRPSFSSSSPVSFSASSTRLRPGDDRVDHHRSDHVPAVPQGPLCSDRTRSRPRTDCPVPDHCRRVPGSWMRRWRGTRTRVDGTRRGLPRGDTHRSGAFFTIGVRGVPRCPRSPSPVTNSAKTSSPFGPESL